MSTQGRLKDCGGRIGAHFEEQLLIINNLTGSLSLLVL